MTNSPTKEMTPETPADTIAATTTGPDKSIIWKLSQLPGRSPGGFKDESASRLRAENETQADASKLDAYFVPIARVAQQSDFFSDVRSKRYRSRALLGPPIDEAFKALDDAVWEVQTKAMMLSDMVKRGGAAFELHSDVVQQYESTIWQHMPGDDPIEPIVKRAIEVAEATCRPILERK